MSENRSYPKVVKCVTVMAAVSLVLGACASSNSSEVAGDDEIVVGFSNPSGAQPVLTLWQQAFTAAAERNNITVKALDAQLNPSKQVTDIDQFVAQQVDAIVVQPLSPDSLTPALERARDAGIKVIGSAAVLNPDDTDIAPYDVNIANNGVFAGAEMSASYVGEQLEGRPGNVLGVAIGVPVPSLQLLMENYESDLAEVAPSATWLGSASNPTDDIAGAEKAVADALTRHKGDVQAVIAYNDASAIGAAVAMANAGINDAVIVGHNADSEGVAAIKDGRIDATVDGVPWRLGLVTDAVVRAVLNNKELPSTIFPQVEFYTKDTIEDRRDWEEAVKDIAAGTLSCDSGGDCPSDLTGS